jgi:hypothetical protein
MPRKTVLTSQLLPENPWTEIAKLSQSALYRRAAIAYCTKDWLNLAKGDLLVVDASDGKIKSGSTSAVLLEKLDARGVEIWSRPGLHAKVICLDETVIIGSANMSSNAEAKYRIELSMVTVDPGILAAVEAFFHKIRRDKHAQKLEEKDIQRLLALPVSPRRNFRTGDKRPVASKRKVNQCTWYASVYRLPETTDAKQKADEEKAERRAQARLNEKGTELMFYHLTERNKLTREIKAGDTIVEAWREERSTDPDRVVSHVSVVQVDRRKDFIRVWVTYPKNYTKIQITWKHFLKLAKSAKLSFTPKRNSLRLMKPAEAEQLALRWPRKA